MKLFFTLWALLIASIGSAKVYYVNVKASGSNNGTSWSNAYQDLQKAIDQVPAGSELWIAAGIYHPVAKTKPYAIKKSLHLYGGFAGGESRMEDRDWTRNITRLSGDLQSDDIESYQDHRADNAYHVLDISLSGGTVYLDGIYVTNGTGNPSGNSTNLYGIGGGILLSGDLELSHCYFLYNAANYGGAVLLLKGSLTMEDCLFQNNYSAYAGGAIYQPNNHTTLSANACTFRANSSGDTGGAFSANLANTSSLKECLFEENSAARGGAVEVTFGARVTCTNSQFRGNNASYLGGVLFVNGSKSTFTAVNCDFEENTQCCQENGVGGGVGVVAYEALLKFDRCHFNYNSTEKQGGCLLIVDADMVADVRFLPNPFWVPDLRDQTGRDAEVSDYVLSREGALDVLEHYSAIVNLVADGYVREGKRYVTIGIGCTGGKHRSVATAERLARMLSEQGHQVVVQHRDLGRE